MRWDFSTFFDDDLMRMALSFISRSSRKGVFRRKCDALSFKRQIVKEPFLSIGSSCAVRTPSVYTYNLRTTEGLEPFHRLVKMLIGARTDIFAGKTKGSKQNDEWGSISESLASRSRFSYRTHFLTLLFA